MHEHRAHENATGAVSIIVPVGMAMNRDQTVVAVRPTDGVGVRRGLACVYVSVRCDGQHGRRPPQHCTGINAER